jgi:8-oxo-dGTP diphosphatase
MKKYSYEYARPAVATDIAVFTLRGGELHVALIRRGQEPFKGMLALPGGFLREDEDLDSCAARELHEETGAQGARLLQFGNFSEPNRDPRYWVVSVAYLALVSAELVQLVAGSDAAAVEWVPISELCHKAKPKVVAKLAFDHAKILEKALTELCARALATGIVLGLLPEKFTLSQMQAAVEAIVKWSPTGSGQVDKRNFRRWVTNTKLVRKAGGMSPTGRRPAQLYAAREGRK